MSEDNTAEDVRGSEAEYISLKVLGQDNTIVTFRIKKCKPLRKLMNTYCTCMGIDAATVKFLFDGQRITTTDTPMNLEMAEGDIIEVYRDQIGGRGTYNCRN